MLWLIIIGTVAVLVLEVSARRTAEHCQLPVELYHLIVAWRAAQCKAEIRAAASIVRRELWTELEEIDRWERGRK